jgi:catechol 2,3-dioxygenase-like lactoylglutathione lyase family enzyme
MTNPPAPPPLTLTATVLDAPDARELADFYVRLLGWDLVADEPGWCKVNPPTGGTGLSFQTEPDHTPPVWPATPGTQQMQLHLDIETTDLPAAVAHATAAGATPATFQPQPDVHVMVDPAGHPFCLWIRT